jgi:Tfp pilus assembly protein PilF
VEDHAASDANEGGNAEEYCRRMVEENPCNSLVLKNYAEFLYQVRFVPTFISFLRKVTQLLFLL